MTGPDKASLVSLFFNYMSVLLRKTWTIAGSSPVGTLNHKNSPLQKQGAVFMVEMTGLEPAASASRTQRSTKLSHISIAYVFLTLEYYNIY